MIDTFSATELAELSIKNLPKTRQAIEYRAKKENWPFEYIKASGRNGEQRRYVLNGLPAEIQTAIREKQAAELLAQAEPAPLPSVVRKNQAPARRKLEQLGLPLHEAAFGLTAKQHDCAHARMALVAEVLKMHNVAGLGITAAIDYVVQQIDSGRLPEHLAMYVPIANARANGRRGISMRTFKSWVSAYREAKTPNERLMALAPRPPKVEVPLAAIIWLPDFMNFHCRPTAPRLTHSYEDFARWWLENRAVNDLPSIDQVRRVWKKLPMMMQERGRKTGAAYKALLPYVQRDWDVLNPGDVWIGDGHSFKAKVQHPVHGRPFKPEVTVIIDGCSRMVVGFSFSLAESCVAVCDALRIGIKHNGRPLIYYSDLGGGQTGKTIDHDITGLAARLEIHHETGLPGNPQGRGIIERWWKDNLIRLAARYDTFTGRGMDSSTKNLTYRKLESAFNALEQGKELTPEQQRYQAKLPRWEQFKADVMQCIADYNNRPHGELPKKADGAHYTPIEYRDQRMAAANLTPDFLTTEELETMFRPQEIRIVQRGWLDLFTNRYFSAELADYHKDEVRVAYDYDDAEWVYVYDLGGKFLAKAQLNGNTRAAFPVSVRDRLAEQRAQGRKKRAENVVKLAEAEKNPALEQANVFDELFVQGMAGGIDADFEVLERTGTDDIVLFKTDLKPI